ncbi:MAG: DUF4198 domain-containing protein [Desulfobulbaceae bacterium]|nr:DUF4198 domain-containing protein [Desulfobulbaceae bacterium]
MTIEFLDTTDHMVHGHEGWLEVVPVRASEGGRVQIFFKWGHNMESHGLARKEGLKFHAISPGGERRSLEISEQKEDCYIVEYTPTEDGIHHLLCENTGYYVVDKEGKHRRGTLKDYPDAPSASFYRQFSHTTLLVGDASKDSSHPDAMAELPFRLVPDSWKALMVGDKICFSLLEGARKLTDISLDLAYTEKPGGPVIQNNLHPDEQAHYSLELDPAGCYLLIARKRIPEGEEGVYYDSSLTYTSLIKVE